MGKKTEIYRKGRLDDLVEGERDAERREQRDARGETERAKSTPENRWLEK